MKRTKLAEMEENEEDNEEDSRMQINNFPAFWKTIHTNDVIGEEPNDANRQSVGNDVIEAWDRLKTLTLPRIATKNRHIRARAQSVHPKFSTRSYCCNPNLKADFCVVM